MAIQGEGNPDNIAIPAGEFQHIRTSERSARWNGLS
jgi:hypothetical protein